MVPRLARSTQTKTYLSIYFLDGTRGQDLNVREGLD